MTAKIAIAIIINDGECRAPYLFQADCKICSLNKKIVFCANYSEKIRMAKQFLNSLSIDELLDI
jgi:hypothetical protein